MYFFLSIGRQKFGQKFGVFNLLEFGACHIFYHVLNFWSVKALYSYKKYVLTEKTHVHFILILSRMASIQNLKESLFVIFNIIYYISKFDGLISFPFAKFKT